MLDFSKSYFELFDLPESFIIDGEQLAERYRALQQLVHPDRHASASDQAQRQALQEASLLNEAMRTLKDPIARAEYLLARRGLPPNTGQNTTNDPAFLFEQMELRETLATAANQPKPDQVIADIMERLQKQQAEWIIVLTTALEENRLTTAQDAMYKLQFLDRLRRNAEEAEAQLDECS